MAHSHTTDIASAAHGSSGRAKPQYDDINVTVVIMVGIISAIVTFLTVISVQGMAYRLESTYLRAANNEFRRDVAAETIAAQKATLEGGEGGAVVPISQAMDLVVAKYSKSGSADHPAAPAGETTGEAAIH